MIVLILAPHPFFQERGTPIAVDLLARALGEDGHDVHVLAFHEGEDRAIPGVTLHRIPALPGVRNIRPGFSIKKLLCDLPFAWHAMRLSRRLKPRIIHAVEEAAYIVWLLRPFFHAPYLLDMDSSIPAQLVESRPWLAPLAPIFRWVERRAIRGATAVVAVCPALADIARQQGGKNIDVLSDISLLNPDAAPAAPAPELAAIDGCRFLYVGNLESYQGIDLLLEALPHALERDASIQVIIVGGSGAHIARYRDLADRLGVGEQVHFLGPRPVAGLAGLLAGADVLLSPRIKGINTPMKIYSYLHSGTPLLATDLPTHAQVLTGEIACLAKAEPPAFGQAMADLAGDAERRTALGKRARAYAADTYTFPAFHDTVRRIYANLAG